MSKLYIISGGPGTGKTTLINALEQRGFRCYPEYARAVIREQLLAGSKALPWEDLGAFSDLVLQKMLVKIADAEQRQTVSFTDRGIPDIIAYLQNGSLPVADAYYENLSGNPYNRTVFLLPPWKEIYAQDNERRESYEASLAIHEALLRSYAACGFETLVLPHTSIEERVKMILDYIHSETNQEFSKPA